MRDLMRRIADATPPTRDRGVDALRALAILGVVLGHWLVTALVADSGTIRATSPLKAMPWLAPASWVLQTMAVFFLVGGMVTARGRAASAEPYGRWLRARVSRLLRPVAAVPVVWLPAAGLMFALGADPGTVLGLLRLGYAPLWFLGVYLILTAATPVAARVHPAWPVAAVALADLIRYGTAGPDWPGWVNVVTAWLVPYCLGAWWARREPPGRTTGWALLLGGAAATAALVLWAGYPASMVGVPGAPISNQSPPTIAAVTFGLAQCGAAALLLPRLRAWLRRPAAWATVALVNLAAMPIFLWHQTAMIMVTALGLAAGTPLPGLHTPPFDPAWIPARLAWLPAFAAALLPLVFLFRPPGPGGTRRGRTGRGRGQQIT